MDHQQHAVRVGGRRLHHPRHRLRLGQPHALHRPLFLHHVQQLWRVEQCHEQGEREHRLNERVALLLRGSAVGRLRQCHKPVGILQLRQLNVQTIILIRLSDRWVLHALCHTHLGMVVTRPTLRRLSGQVVACAQEGLRMARFALQVWPTQGQGVQRRLYNAHKSDVLP